MAENSRDLNEVLGALADQIVLNRTKDADQALATVAYKLLHGLPPFPSQVDDMVERLYALGSRRGLQKAARVEEALSKSERS